MPKRLDKNLSMQFRFRCKKRRGIVLSLTMLFCISLLNVLPLHSAEMKDITLDNYRTILPERWLAYLHALGTVEGTKTRRYVRNGNLESEFTGEIIYNYPILADIRGPITGGLDEVAVTGKDYRFRLERKEPTDAWVIERIAGVEEKAPVLESWLFPEHFSADRSKEDSVGYDIFNTLGVGLFAYKSIPNLPDIFQKENFKINKIEFLVEDGKKRLFLDFDYTYDAFPPHLDIDFKNHPHWKPYSLQGQVWLETDYFLISKGIFHTRYLADECHSTVKCEYDSNTYKVPLPKQYQLVTQYNFPDDNMKGVLETYIDFDLRETNPKDTKRFTLSAFGLPEPDFGPRRMSLFRIVMMALGGLVVLVALWKKATERKEKKAS